jgi:sugar phosphate isomerase/epimerase
MMTSGANFIKGDRRTTNPLRLREISVIERTLGTMVTFGYPEIELDDELALAVRIGASVLEILPDWSRLPDAALIRTRAGDRGLSIHSAHGCWGGRKIRARRVDLGSTDPDAARESVDDLKVCIDWIAEAGGNYVVVHPGGLSYPVERVQRRAALAEGLRKLAKHAEGTGITVCVENMPPGVNPGSSMAELFELICELNHAQLALALDTGHANLNATAALETQAAGSLLATTHVHDNNGRQDSHEPPGIGTIDWPEWRRALDSVNYRGPILLECIRHLRHNPESLKPELLEMLVRASTPISSDPERL